MAVVRYALRPMVAAMLPGVLGAQAAGALSAAYVGVFKAAWLVPAYVLSLPVSALWYAELAQLAIVAGQKQVLVRRAERQGTPISPHATPVRVSQSDGLESLAETLYRALLLAAIFVAVALLDWVPLLGHVSSAALLAWTYALYSFDYKWSSHGVPLTTRIAFVESNWAYFLGFGFVSVAPTLVVSTVTGGALVGLLFPLFVIQACASHPKRTCQQVRDLYSIRGPMSRAPIFSPIGWALNGTLRLLSVSGLRLLAAALGSAPRSPAGDRRAP